MNDKFNFASVEWLQMLEHEWRALANTLESGKQLSISEIYTNTPPHLSNDGRNTVAWTCWLESPNIRFVREANDDVDLRIEGEYETLKELASLVVTPENSDDYQKLAATALQQKKINFVGDPSVAAIAQELHNLVASKTA